MELECLYLGHLGPGSGRPTRYLTDLFISWSLKAFTFATPGIMASSLVPKASSTWSCLGFVDLVCLARAPLLWVFTLWIGLFCFAFSVSSFWLLTALILHMSRVGLCCVSDSWVNCDGRRVRASDSGRSRKWPPFVLRGWGREGAAHRSSATAGRVPAHMEGLSANRQVRDWGLRIAASLPGEGRIWSPPEKAVHARTIEGLRDCSPGKWKAQWLPLFSVELNTQSPVSQGLKRDSCWCQCGAIPYISCAVRAIPVGLR